MTAKPTKKADAGIKVRTSMRPDREITVSDAEHVDLEAQGLLVQSEKNGARLRTQEGSR